MPADAFERRDTAREGPAGARRSRTVPPDYCAQECLDALDNHLAPVKQHLPDANGTREQQRHVKMDERRRPMDPGDGTETWRGPRAGHRLDVLLHEVEGDLGRGERQPYGDES